MVTGRLWPRSIRLLVQSDAQASRSQHAVWSQANFQRRACAMPVSFPPLLRSMLYSTFITLEMRFVKFRVPPYCQMLFDAFHASILGSWIRTLLCSYSRPNRQKNSIRLHVHFLNLNLLCLRRSLQLSGSCLALP